MATNWNEDEARLAQRRIASKAIDYKPGDIVEALETSTRRAGMRGEVIEVYEQNGFRYVVTDSMGSQRAQDLKKVIE